MSRVVSQVVRHQPAGCSAAVPLHPAPVMVINPITIILDSRVSPVVISRMPKPHWVIITLVHSSRAIIVIGIDNSVTMRSTGEQFVEVDLDVTVPSKAELFLLNAAKRKHSSSFTKDAWSSSSSSAGMKCHVAPSKNSLDGSSGLWSKLMLSLQQQAPVLLTKTNEDISRNPDVMLPDETLDLAAGLNFIGIPKPSTALDESSIHSPQKETKKAVIREASPYACHSGKRVRGKARLRLGFSNVPISRHGDTQDTSEGHKNEESSSAVKMSLVNSSFSSSVSCSNEKSTAPASEAIKQNKSSVHILASVQDADDDAENDIQEKNDTETLATLENEEEGGIKMDESMVTELDSSSSSSLHSNGIKKSAGLFLLPAADESKSLESISSSGTTTSFSAENISNMSAISEGHLLHQDGKNSCKTVARCSETSKTPSGNLTGAAGDSKLPRKFVMSPNKYSAIDEEKNMLPKLSSVTSMDPAAKERIFKTKQNVHHPDVAPAITSWRYFKNDLRQPKMLIPASQTSNLSTSISMNDQTAQDTISTTAEIFPKAQQPYETRKFVKESFKMATGTQTINTEHNGDRKYLMQATSDLRTEMDAQVQRLHQELKKRPLQYPQINNLEKRLDNLCSTVLNIDAQAKALEKRINEVAAQTATTNAKFEQNFRKLQEDSHHFVKKQETLFKHVQGYVQKQYSHQEEHFSDLLEQYVQDQLKQERQKEYSKKTRGNRRKNVEHQHQVALVSQLQHTVAVLSNLLQSTSKHLNKRLSTLELMCLSNNCPKIMTHPQEMEDDSCFYRLKPRRISDTALVASRNTSCIMMRNTPPTVLQSIMPWMKTDAVQKNERVKKAEVTQEEHWIEQQLCQVLMLNQHSGNTAQKVSVLSHRASQKMKRRTHQY
ncbi:unnamed protein product [Notodromas monacha]|uniref:Uncharacterized protein n=1 Tax=Notodromas monacha TaxID=399045 RepID=A0A7R9G933_9CRUS|nr:unnamed protein product [Notodromas monacha]CAG0913895.1 unnamed protein product [Notodromas monacha]